MLLTFVLKDLSNVTSWVTAVGSHPSLSLPHRVTDGTGSALAGTAPAFLRELSVGFSEFAQATEGYGFRVTPWYDVPVTAALPGSGTDVLPRSLLFPHPCTSLAALASDLAAVQLLPSWASKLVWQEIFLFFGEFVFHGIRLQIQLTQTLDEGDGEEGNTLVGDHVLRYRKVRLPTLEIQDSRHCFVILSPLLSSSTFLWHIITSLFTGNAIHLEMALLIFCPSFLNNPARPVTEQHIRRHSQTAGTTFKWEASPGEAVTVMMSK